MPKATEVSTPDRQLSGFGLIRALQHLPAAVLEMPASVYVKVTDHGVEVALEDES